MYGQAETMDEQHRHRYEVNPDYIELLEEKAGLYFIGRDETGRRMEVVERKDHSFFVGVQVYPEYTSRVLPLSPTFVAASAGSLEEIMADQQARRVRGIIPKVEGGKG